MLLSPAKTLDLSATKIKLRSTPVLESEAKVLVSELQKLSKSQLKSLLGVSDSICSLNFERYQRFYDQPAKQAILSFDGPAFKGLNMRSLSDGVQAKTAKS